MCRRGPMRSRDVADRLGFGSKFEINPTLYYMQRHRLAQQENAFPLKWGLPDGYNHEFNRWSVEQGLKEESEEDENDDEEEEDDDDEEEEEVMIIDDETPQPTTSEMKAQSSGAAAPIELSPEQQAQLQLLMAMKSRPLGTASVSQLEAKLQMSAEEINQWLQTMGKVGLVSLVDKDQSLWVMTTQGENYLAVATPTTKIATVTEKSGSAGQAKSGSVGQAKSGSIRPLPPHLYVTVNPDFAPSEEEVTQAKTEGQNMDTEEPAQESQVTTTLEPQEESVVQGSTEETSTSTTTSTVTSTSTSTATTSTPKSGSRPLPPHMVEMERTGKLPEKFLESQFHLCSKDLKADKDVVAGKSNPLIKTYKFSTLTKESYAVLNKNPISALMEYAQSRQLSASIDLVRQIGPPHNQRFIMAVTIGDRHFPRVEGTNKKEARKEAADVALRLLVEEGAFNTSKKKKKNASAVATAMDTSSSSTGTASPGKSAPALSNESFAAINKNPISALMEYAQARQLSVQIELLTQSGPPHAPKFVMAATVGGRQFPWVTKSSKKEGKTEAAQAALQLLISEGSYSLTPESSVPTEITGNMTHFDKMAALSHQAFNSLAAKVFESFVGRKVIAAMILKRGEEDDGTVISVGSGNRCITGDKLSLEGNTVNDSHAEIITRRGLLRFLYQQLLLYTPGEPHELFEVAPSGKLKVKDGITFHLYISTAPCGDGALFSPRDSENRLVAEVDTGREHHPTFTSNAQGLLRTKMEGGEGTIPIESDFRGQTFDGIQRGERLRTMSCTDKICRWNVVGMQGALLSHFLEPIYLDSLTLGYLYDHGHLARAVCCRLARGDPPLSDSLPDGFHLNHPWLGRVTMCDPPRETQKTKADSINWCLGDETPEVLDGTLGICNTGIEKTLFSRVRKRALYEKFQQVCRKFDRSDLLGLESYNDAKNQAVDFQTAKAAMLKTFAVNKCGPWVGKPVEEGMFS
ncbi:double-stranded RNA-specific adenosine deaminase-like [Liolophura sinensis]|uniref:double-stranded RNA-specific adenosine deaminase-like n=1 Tax=Liolophura sinensis TaxID=3198878 RepID=UPI00315850F7